MNPGLLVLITAAAFLIVIGTLAVIQEWREAKENEKELESARIRAERAERRKAAQESAKEIFYIYLEVITK